MRLRSRDAKHEGTTTEVTDPIRNFQTVPHKVVKVDSEHISTAHIEWPEGKQSSESCGCRRSHLIILDVVVVEKKKRVTRFCGKKPFNYGTRKQSSTAVLKTPCPGSALGLFGADTT